MRSSPAAFDLIIEEEVGSEAAYTQRYSGLDWPGGGSGVTIGVGYDLGQVSKMEIRGDWAALLLSDQLAVLMSAQGLKGMDASNFVRHNKCTIPWGIALKEFQGEMKKWEMRVLMVLPNADQLPPDSFGALVSLAYNRGCGGFTAPGDRYKEMRAIKNLMLSKTFSRIPDQIRSMKRLWNNGLVNRREREAQLFERGIESPAIARLPSRQQIVVDRVALTGVATGGAVLGIASFASLPTAHWAAPLATVSLVIAVLISLQWTKHQLLPKAD